ncbi:MAG: outer membrane lipoprotein carrier protein LolA [Endomicrobium sp.]|jgi:chaperone LolA|nr:outer membrane lipoprotein carrier protein LolA [Endomicrobium sp.]
MFFIIFSLDFVCASQGKALDFLLKMEKTNNKIDSLRVDFTQTVLFESTKEEQKIVGVIYFKKPDSIYINQKTSQEQLIYINGKNVTIYTPDNKQAIIGKWNDIIGKDFVSAIVVNFGSSWRKIKKASKINLVGENERYAIIKITSVNKNWSLKVCISKLTMLPCKAVAKSDGTTIEIIFKSYTINPSLDKNMFKLDTVDNIEIIKLN